MNNTWLIAQREYISRVKTKTFLLTTFATPIGFLLFFVLIGFIMNRGSDNVKTLKVSDPSGIMDGELGVRSNLEYTFSGDDLESLKEEYKNGDIDGVLLIPALDSSSVSSHTIQYYSDDRLALDEMSSIENAIERKIREYKVVALDLDEAKIALLKTNVDIEQEAVIDTEKEISSVGTMVGAVFGVGLAYILFIVIFMYGSQVMRSVMEEKINRIVEVLMSTVKPFELMMGKILGVGAVGLTQMAAWTIILAIGYFAAFAIFGFSANPADMSGMGDMMGVSAEDMQAAMEANQDSGKIEEIMREIGKLNWGMILPLVLFYFLTGYFAYAAMFAAVGSAVGEDINEAQSLTLPIMMPLMLAFYIGFAAFRAPNSSVAVWGSIIPLTSSIVMPVRLPIDPPFWQIALSVVLLIAFVFAMTWLAARIYRVGILLYGKKASFKELGKWIFYKG